MPKLTAQVKLRAAVVHLRKGSLPYCPGQKGGYVVLPNGDTVSARGALRRAGVPAAQIEAMTALPETENAPYRLSIRGVSEAPREAGEMPRAD